jgi:hypothetical protein
MGDINDLKISHKLYKLQLQRLILYNETALAIMFALFILRGDIDKPDHS